MRSFLLVANQAATRPFTLNGLPNAGRMDLVCRFMAQALFLSHGIRRDTCAYALLGGPPEPPKALLVRGSQVRSLSPDERNIGGLIRKALALPLLPAWRESTPGVYVAKKELASLLDEHSGCIAYLVEDGRDIRGVAERLEDCLFVLGDHRGLKEEQESLVRREADYAVRLSPHALQADQCVTIAHYELDRAAGGSSEGTMSSRR